MIPMMGSYLCSGASGANTRHSTYSFRCATIAYPWHPLFGRTLQVSPFRRGKDLRCIYTDERPDLCREIPNRMFDEGYCAGMKLGAPEISIKALSELAAVLGILGENRTPGARSHPSKEQEEEDSAKKSLSQPSATYSRSGTLRLGSSPEGEPEWTCRSLGRSSAGGPRCRRHDDEGRR